jgi:hypothetical protein
MLKVPHWVIIACAAILSAVTWVLAMNSSGQLPLPAMWIAVLGQVVIIVKAATGILSDSPATAATLARAGVRALSMLALLAFAACAWLKQAAPGIVNIANSTCTQLDSQPEPAWVYFVCAIEQAGGALVQTLIAVPANKAAEFKASHHAELPSYARRVQVGSAEARAIGF